MERFPNEPAEPPRWYGDLDDDCFAGWAGLSLHAEKMDPDEWWWGVTDDNIRRFAAEEPGEQVASSSRSLPLWRTGAEARKAAEEAARAYLRKKWRRTHWVPRNKKPRRERRRKKKD